MRLVLLMMTALAALAACGKLGSPTAPGPANQITYPKSYPTH
jgi:predicted small lipoprotein YifL